MNKLLAALQRLYLVDGQPWFSRQSAAGPAAAVGPLTAELLAQSLAGEISLAFDPVSPGGKVRAMVVGVDDAADWQPLAELHQGIQDDLALPPPAISVSATAGYQLWLSLAEGVPVAAAGLFLALLRRKYLADIPLSRLRFFPATGGEGLVNLVPAQHAASGKWSAFIDPTLGAMFVDEPGLAMAPTMDRQADMLAGLESITAADFQRAVDLLQGLPEGGAALPESPGDAGQPLAGQGLMRSTLQVGNNFSDPQSFLLAVMNDASATAGQRIRAAKALLPYFAAAGPK